jgi:hypothetical protein
MLETARAGCDGVGRVGCSRDDVSDGFLFQAGMSIGVFAVINAPILRYLGSRLPGCKTIPFLGCAVTSTMSKD